MDDLTTYHALAVDDGRFLAEIEVEDSTHVAEIITPDDNGYTLVFSFRDMRNEVAAHLGIDDEDVYITDEDETTIII